MFSIYKKTKKNLLLLKYVFFTGVFYVFTDVLYFLGGMSLREAEATFGVPRATISDKMSGKSDPVVLQRGQKKKFYKEIEDR